MREIFNIDDFKVDHPPLPSEQNTLEQNVKILSDRGMSPREIASNLWLTREVELFSRNNALKETSGYLMFLNRVEKIMGEM